MYKLVYFVPESHLDITKSAIFDAGAGRYANYDQCCWQCRGTGQFRPLDGANPHIGNQQQLTTVDEYRVEVICAEQCMDAVIAALKLAHPYEEVAYEAWRLDFVG